MAVIELGVIQYRGLSSDEKPAGKIGDRFTELDTNKTFVKRGTWIEEEIAISQAPPSGYQVTNFYIDPNTEEEVIEYES